MWQTITQTARKALGRPAAENAGPNHVIFRRADVQSRETAADGLPVPPRALWNSGAATIEAYMNQGAVHYRGMRAILDAHGFRPVNVRILDFGSGAGRTLRMWDDAANAELWGCDINAEQIQWCQHNLGRRFRFFENTVFPHLPLEDGYFDLVYAGSVFTHISNLVDSWLLELRRVVKHCGLLFVTIHDENTWRIVREGKGPALESSLKSHPEGEKPSLDADFVSFGVGPESNTFFRRDYFTDKAAQYFDVVDVKPEARGYQTAILLRKP